MLIYLFARPLLQDAKNIIFILFKTNVKPWSEGQFLPAS